MIKKKYDVLGIGNAIVDLIAPVDKSFLETNNLMYGSMTLVDKDRSLEIQKLLKKKQTQAGGSVANTIAGIAMLGGRCSFIGKRKNDLLGDAFYKSMNDLNIYLPNELSEGAESTANCIVLVTPDGQRTMCTYLGISVYLNELDIIEETIKNSDIIYFEGYLFDLPDAKSAFIKAARIAKKNNKKVALSLSDSFCVDRHRESFKNFLTNHVDILFANEAEVKSLFELDSLERAFKEVKKLVKISVVTRGEYGAVMYDGNKKYEREAINVKVIDTTGAGDLFAAGFLLAFTKKMSNDDCLKSGIICSSEVIKAYGARPNKNLIKILREYDLLF